MKKVIFSLSILALLVSCSDDDETGKDPNIITLSAAVEKSSLLRSGPISSNFTTDFPIGIYAYNGAWNTTNEINNDQATVLGAAGHNVVFGSGPYYYPSDGTDIHFYAFAPQATSVVTPPASGTAPVVSFSITGQEDVMWTSATGHKTGSAPAVNPVLSFQHKQTQLQFTLKADVTYPSSGNKVVSLTVKQQPTAVTMDVGTGICTFAASLADMQALSTANMSAGLDITSAGNNASSPVMTNASSGSTAYILDIVVKPAGVGIPNVTYTSIPVNLTTFIGSAHMITLTFTETAVTASATVADWLTGTGGNVTVL